MLEQYKIHLPAELYGQIEEICESFKAIHQEVGGLLQQGKMPDNAAHLTNVLASTEEATNTILDAAGLIGDIANASIPSDASKQQVSDHINRIYEACTFQDITGQRIMKVLKNLGVIEAKLNRLSEIAKSYGAAEPVMEPDTGNPLLQGPSLTNEAPSQADIDKLFQS